MRRGQLALFSESMTVMEEVHAQNSSETTYITMSSKKRVSLGSLKRRLDKVLKRQKLAF